MKKKKFDPKKILMNPNFVRKFFDNKKLRPKNLVGIKNLCPIICFVIMTIYVRHFIVMNKICVTKIVCDVIFFVMKHIV